VKRFFAFHSLSPCRSSTRVPVMGSILPQQPVARARTSSGAHHVEIGLRRFRSATKL
jgi:hypothetical protein